uniref:Uncharacterized protein n=1 Tax=Kuenenia stuttgartiensis TaxID=174633 RepID=Q1Q4C2_KUEST|nr:unknown protein [Candidatus Kuenenia stuttgartiensis]
MHYRFFVTLYTRLSADWYCITSILLVIFLAQAGSLSYYSPLLAFLQKTGNAPVLTIGNL